MSNDIHRLTGLGPTIIQASGDAWNKLLRTEEFDPNQMYEWSQETNGFSRLICAAPDCDCGLPKE